MNDKTLREYYEDNWKRYKTQKAFAAALGMRSEALLSYHFKTGKARVCGDTGRCYIDHPHGRQWMGWNRMEV